MTVPPSTASHLVALGRYRARIAELYSDVRRSTASHQDTWLAWSQGRRDILASDPMSAFAGGDLPPAPLWRYSEQWRTAGIVRETDVDDLLLAETDDVVRRFVGVGVIEFAIAGASHSLPIYWADSYGGGWFLPFRDETNGRTTFGSGRYALDGAKGADLGTTGDGDLVLDFNYAVHPSCVWGDWLCPLPSSRASIPLAITAGECKHEPEELRHGSRCERFGCGAFVVDGAVHDCC